MANPAAGRSGATTWILAGAALLVVVGFLVWLGVTAEPSVVTVIREDTAADTMAPPAGGEGAAVSAADLGANAAQYHDQTVQLQGVTIAQRMGPRVVFLDLPTGPFLVKLSEALAAAPPSSGARVDITGTVRAKTDAVLDEWEQEGTIRNAGDRAAMSAGSSFLDAVRITPARGQ